jgi:hypothetical protein
MEYASNAKANTAVTLGAVGTGLGVLSGAGGLAGLLGLGPRNAPPDPGDRPVTRYEMGLYKEISEKNDEIVLLKANRYSDNKDEALQAQINQQAVWNASATATMGCMAQQLQQLFGITKLMIPNSNIAPGWGSAIVEPVPVPATAQGTGTTGG